VERFDYNAPTVPLAANYFRNRAFQLLADGFQWSGEVTPLHWESNEWGAETTYLRDGDEYYSTYVLANARGDGHMKRYLPKMASMGAGFVTTGPCKVYELLSRYVKNVQLVGEHLEWPAYRAVERFYESRQAERSGLFLMNHVDEGVAILRQYGLNNVEDKEVLSAFMLHPLVQRDEDLAFNWERLRPRPRYQHDGGYVYHETPQDLEALMLALEYRNIANQFLSPMEHHPGYENHEKIALSHPSVSFMLLADKVQNYKDFLAHHKESHHRARFLDRYFKQWFRRLDLSLDDYHALAARITVPEPTINEIPKIA